MTTLRQTRTKQGGVVTGNKEAGRKEHMANNNKDRAMCSDTTQTKNKQTDRTDKAVRGDL